MAEDDAERLPAGVGQEAEAGPEGRVRQEVRPLPGRVLGRAPVVAEGLVAHQQGVRRALRGEADDLHAGRRRDVGERRGQVPRHPVKPARLPVAVRRVQGDRPVVAGQAPGGQRQRPPRIALPVQRNGRPLGPVKQPAAEPAVPVGRVHAALLPHLMHRVSGAPGQHAAEAGHGVPVVDGDGAAGEIGVRIAEILPQVLLAEVLVAPVHGLDGGEQRCPGRHVRRTDRPPVECPAIAHGPPVSAHGRIVYRTGNGRQRVIRQHAG